MTADTWRGGAVACGWVSLVADTSTASAHRGRRDEPMPHGFGL